MLERVSRAELRALALAAVALTLFGLVGLASARSAWHAPHTGAGAPTALLRALAATGGVVLAAALLLILAETPKAPPRKRKRPTMAGDELDELGRSFWTAAKTAAVVLLALAVFCIAALPLLTRATAPPGASSGTRPAPSARPRPTQAPRTGDSFNLGWLLIPMALTLTILAPAVVLIRRRNRAEDAATEEHDVLARAVQASIAALESERDPRRAILCAYAGMEEAFGNVEVVRARDETASEFLGRAMRRLRVSGGAAAALTERFEEARYSTHRVTQRDRDQALASLHRVEEELAKPR